MKTKLLILGLLLQAPLAFARPHRSTALNDSTKTSSTEVVAAEVAAKDSLMEAKADSLDAEVALPADLIAPLPKLPNAIDEAEALSPDTLLDVAEFDSAFVAAIEEMSVRWHYNLVEMDSCQSLPIQDTLTKDDYVRLIAAMPTLIEMPYNNVVRSYINSYVNRYPKRLSHLLGLSKYYFPYFEQELEAANLPLELRNLPIIESALNPSARSRVGAGGLWQFMPGTGQLYGLKINTLIDERCDPIKSTKAAVCYLKDLYSIYGDWMLVIAAYNCGPGNVNKAIRRSGGKRDYWDIYNFLPRETRGYVPAFIAANFATYYGEEFFHICPAEITLPLVVDTVQVNYRVHFEQIAHHLDVEVDELRRLNPQYRYDLVPGNASTCTLYLPANVSGDLISQRDTIIAYKKDLIERKVENKIASQTTYKVRSGDNLWTIARKHGVTVMDIRRANYPKQLNVLQIGQRIKLPARR